MPVDRRISGFGRLRVVVFAADLVEEAVLDDLPQHTVEDLRGDLAGVRGRLAQLVVRLLLCPLQKQ